MTPVDRVVMIVWALSSRGGSCVGTGAVAREYGASDRYVGRLLLLARKQGRVARGLMGWSRPYSRPEAALPGAGP